MAVQRYKYLQNMVITKNGDQVTRSENTGTMTADQIKLSAELKKLFPAYLNSLGLKSAKGSNTIRLEIL